MGRAHPGTLSGSPHTSRNAWGITFEHGFGNLGKWGYQERSPEILQPIDTSCTARTLSGSCGFNGQGSPLQVSTDHQSTWVVGYLTL